MGGANEQDPGVRYLTHRPVARLERAARRQPEASWHGDHSSTLFAYKQYLLSARWTHHTPLTHDSASSASSFTLCGLMWSCGYRTVAPQFGQSTTLDCRYWALSGLGILTCP